MDAPEPTLERRVVGVQVVMDDGNLVTFDGDGFGYAEVANGALMIGPYSATASAGITKDALIASGLWRYARLLWADGVTPPRGAPDDAWLKNRIEKLFPHAHFMPSGSSWYSMWEAVHTAIDQAIRSHMIDLAREVEKDPEAVGRLKGRWGAGPKESLQ